MVLLLSISSSVSACTGFSSSTEQQVLLGNNEDWLYPDVYLHFLPSEAGKFGRMFINCNYPLSSNPEYFTAFAGINDMGLCYDIFLHPFLHPVNSSSKPVYPGDLMAHCLETCSTVDEVLYEFDKYNLGFMDDIQYFVVDASGASAIIEGDAVILKHGNYQVVTNFLQSHPWMGEYPCWRYETAVGLLEEMPGLSVDYCRDICAATHQVGMYPTIYSYVMNAKMGLVYLYHYHKFSNVVTFNLTEELSLGGHSYYLPGLFEPVDNQPPCIPDRPVGPTSGLVRVEHTYTTYSSDPNQDVMYYLFDWGDGTRSHWIKQQDLGEGIASHTWLLQGSYEVRVKAKDIYGRESNWSEPLSVSMPKNFFFDGRFPFLRTIIQTFWGLFQDCFSFFP